MLSKDTPEKYVVALGEKCERCGHCCSFGSGFFLDKDIERIASHMGMKKEDFTEKFLEETTIYNKQVHKAKLEKEDGKAYGPCIFFKGEDGCVVHEVKPLHCRITKGCGEYGEQLSIWFTLNYLVNSDDPESIRQWAQSLRTHETIPGGELLDLIKDKEKLQKILSYEILK